MDIHRCHKRKTRFFSPLFCLGPHCSAEGLHSWLCVQGLFLLVLGSTWGRIYVRQGTWRVYYFTSLQYLKYFNWQSLLVSQSFLLPLPYYTDFIQLLYYWKSKSELGTHFSLYFLLLWMPSTLHCSRKSSGSSDSSSHLCAHCVRVLEKAEIKEYSQIPSEHV